jgi:hypothetical protein
MNIKLNPEVPYHSDYKFNGNPNPPAEIRHTTRADVTATATGRWPVDKHPVLRMNTGTMGIYICVSSYSTVR